MFETENFIVVGYADEKKCIRNYIVRQKPKHEMVGVFRAKEKENRIIIFEFFFKSPNFKTHDIVSEILKNYEEIKGRPIEFECISEKDAKQPRPKKKRKKKK